MTSASVVHVICDGCRSTAALEFPHDFETAGWTFTKPKGVRCPDCAEPSLEDALRLTARGVTSAPSGITLHTLDAAGNLQKQFYPWSQDWDTHPELGQRRDQRRRTTPELVVFLDAVGAVRHMFRITNDDPWDLDRRQLPDRCAAHVRVKRAIVGRRRAPLEGKHRHDRRQVGPAMKVSKSTGRLVYLQRVRWAFNLWRDSWLDNRRVTPDRRRLPNRRAVYCHVCEEEEPTGTCAYCRKAEYGE